MLSTLGVSEARIETGSMRVDINLSVHSATSPVSTPRIEIKNLDSFDSVERSIEYEYRRLVSLLEEG